MSIALKLVAVIFFIWMTVSFIRLYPKVRDENSDLYKRIIERIPQFIPVLRYGIPVLIVYFIFMLCSISLVLYIEIIQ